MNTLQRPALKQPTGWFAAGASFLTALTRLSDGAFKLFAYLCLQTNRHSGRVETSHRELMAALGKSKRSIGSYVEELQTHRVCTILPAKNQYARTVFEIADDFWPYYRCEDDRPASSDLAAYVESVRQSFLSLGCVSGRFTAADETIAKHMHERAIPFTVVENAMLLGACRKYEQWLCHQQVSEPIQSLRYFDTVVAEVHAQPLPARYALYLRHKLQQYAQAILTMQSTPDGVKPNTPRRKPSPASHPPHHPIPQRSLAQNVAQRNRRTNRRDDAD
jgi:hypothetical protein